jgi:hypothetical protein
MSIFAVGDTSCARYCLILVLSSDMNRKDTTCKALVEKTENALKDNNILASLFVSTQQTEINLCVEYAVKYEYLVFKLLDNQ